MPQQDIWIYIYQLLCYSELAAVTIHRSAYTSHATIPMQKCTRHIVYLCQDLLPNARCPLPSQSEPIFIYRCCVVRHSSLKRMSVGSSHLATRQMFMCICIYGMYFWFYSNLYMYMQTCTWGSVGSPLPPPPTLRTLGHTSKNFRSWRPISYNYKSLWIGPKSLLFYGLYSQD